MGHGDYPSHVANISSRVCPIRHTALLRDCVHTGTLVSEIPPHQSDSRGSSDGSGHLPSGTAYLFRLFRAALAGTDTTRLFDVGLLAAAAVVRAFSSGDVLRHNAVPAGKQTIWYSRIHGPCHLSLDFAGKAPTGDISGPVARDYRYSPSRLPWQRAPLLPSLRVLGRTRDCTIMTIHSASNRFHALRC